jgi:hypothetical protein
VLLPDSAMRVQIGDICCSITCDDREVAGSLHESYKNFISDKPADISVRLAVVDRLSAAEIKPILPRVEAVQKDFGFATTLLTFEGEYDAASRTLNMIAEKHLFDPSLKSRIMNRVLPLVYFTACGMQNGSKRPAMLLHACAIIRHQQAIIFTGPSGTGKTTIARLCGDTHGHILNDEMVLCSWPNGERHPPIVRGTPILGEVAHRLNTAAPLRCILMLKQAERTSLRRLHQMEAYLRIMCQVIAPRHFNTAHDDVAAMLLQNTEFSEILTEKVPFYELEFTLDKDVLWNVIAELEESLTKGELVA